MAWFGAGTLAGGAVSLFEPAATLLGSGPALLGVAVGLAWRGPDQATRSPLCATGRWLGTGLAVAAFLPGVTPSPGGTIRMALAP